MSEESTALQHTGPVVTVIDSYSVIDCIACGFKHVTPTIQEDELTRFYEEAFYQKEKPNYFKDAEESKSWWTNTYDRYFSLLEKHVQGKRLLDVGSGPGYFLDAGVSRGWDVVGIEPSPEAVAYSQARGLRVLNDFFSADKLTEEKSFDVVALNFVLEHVPDPKGFLEEVKKVLNPGGLIFIVVPNDFNPFQSVLEIKGFKPWWVLPQHHLNYFNFNSITKLLERIGFNVVEQSTTFPMEFFLLSGRNYVGNPDLGTECHEERVAFENTLYEQNPELLASLYAGLATKGLGREVVVIGQMR